jgi:hypothetical protein
MGVILQWSEVLPPIPEVPCSNLDLKIDCNDFDCSCFFLSHSRQIRIGVITRRCTPETINFILAAVRQTSCYSKALINKSR